MLQHAPRSIDNVFGEKIILGEAAADAKTNVVHHSYLDKTWATVNFGQGNSNIFRGILCRESKHGQEMRNVRNELEK